MSFDGFETSRVGGVPLVRCTMNDAVSATISAASLGEAFAIRFVNAYSVVSANQQGAFAALLNSGGVNLPDGTPVALCMKADLRRKSTTTRTRGPSFMKRVLDEGRSSGTTHFFIGGTPESLDLLLGNIRERWPGTQIVGAYSPPFAPLDDDYIARCVDAVRDSRASIVWVGIGSPKQDLLASAISASGRHITVGVGAAFDFIAGTVREAPPSVQRLGLEWLWRLASEPRRLWRRYLVGNAQFVWYAATQR